VSLSHYFNVKSIVFRRVFDPCDMATRRESAKINSKINSNKPTPPSPLQKTADGGFQKERNQKKLVGACFVFDPLLKVILGVKGCEARN
jgi:hypothetical protein